MCNRGQRKRDQSHLETSDIAYWMIRFVHDNPLLAAVRNPHRILRAAGVEERQTVLEVGCGPGFFTIPAAEIVGEEGHVYAVDVHPRAVARVRNKVERMAVTNVTPLCVNASDTGLPDESIDMAFLFGLQHVAGGLDGVIAELGRVVRPGGILSIEKTRGSEAALIEAVARGGFAYTERRKRIFLFTRKGA